MRPKSLLIANILPVYSLSTQKIDITKPAIFIMKPILIMRIAVTKPRIGGAW
jgi:hypothetical protein